MNKMELARALGIYRQMVYKLIDQDMPVDSVESAKQWRKKILNPYKTKEYRLALVQAGIKVKNEHLASCKQETWRQDKAFWTPDSNPI